MKRETKSQRITRERRELLLQVWLIYDADGQGDWENYSSSAEELARMVPVIRRLWELEEKAKGLLNDWNLKYWKDPQTLTKAMYESGLRPLKSAPGYLVGAMEDD